MYANGEGVTQDMEKAVEWWRQSAQQGNANAQEFFGRAGWVMQGINCAVPLFLSGFMTSAYHADSDSDATIISLLPRGRIACVVALL